MKYRVDCIGISYSLKVNERFITDKDVDRSIRFESLKTFEGSKSKKIVFGRKRFLRSFTPTIKSEQLGCCIAIYTADGIRASSSPQIIRMSDPWMYVQSFQMKGCRLWVRVSTNLVLGYVILARRFSSMV
jgi:hypothetical protein